MTVSDLCNSYMEARHKMETRLVNMDAKVWQLRRQAEYFQEKAADSIRSADKVLERMRKVPKVDWVEYAVCPLAKELRKRSKKKFWTLLGPDACSHQTWVLLHDVEADKALKLCMEQPCLEIVLRPQFDKDYGFLRLSLLYETGEYTNDHYTGGREDLEYLNAVTAPLPDSIDDVVKLLKPVEMMIP